MSKKFNPLSAAVALATAGVMVAVGGCAMGTRSDDMSTAQAPLSREESQAPGQQQMAQTAQADTSMTPSTSATAPADTWTASSAQAPQTMARNDTSATPYPNSADTQQPQPAATMSNNTDYNRGTSTDYSSNSSSSANSANSANASSSMSSSTDMSSSSSTNNNGDQPLPARADRN